MRDEIINVVSSNRVILLSGETGCGKTTQVPQMVLEYCGTKNIPCRIVCTQPRRISAVTVAEFVAQEWGEKVGQTIGYRIRLESKMCSSSSLVYCTTGTLLRMMVTNSSLDGITHIILDEVHERDRYSDFLLILVKELLRKRDDLTVVLMTATLHAELFVQYFAEFGCQRLHIKGFAYPVTEHFLEDVLKFAGSDKLKKAPVRVKSAQKQEEAELRAANRAWVGKEIIEDIEQGFLASQEDALSSLYNIYHLILDEGGDVNTQHPVTGVTAMMVVGAKGIDSLIEPLLKLGADKNLAAANGFTASDFAKHFGNSECAQILDDWGSSHGDTKRVVTSEEDLAMLESYHQVHNDEQVDLELIQSLVGAILRQRGSEGAILIFLPGLDEILRLQEMLRRGFPGKKLNVLPLHSSCSASEQRRVFQKQPEGVRKVVLSTNIAETSVTIDDVVHVIDSGKMKEKSYDSLTGVGTLDKVWTSRASAKQRRGRAGRCQSGHCYHLFSRRRYDSLREYQIPELLRIPLHEICLQAKLLGTNRGESLSEFLAKAPEPPRVRAVEDAVDLLQRIDAFDKDAEITQLGHNLLSLSIEPILGRMLLMGVYLRCLDPILTIACAMSNRDPFMSPMNPAHKAAAKSAKEGFALGKESDHFAILNAFAGWQHASNKRFEYKWCNDNFVNNASMGFINGMRNQLLQQLASLDLFDSSNPKEVNQFSHTWSVIKATLCAGLYPNVARSLPSTALSFQTATERRVKVQAGTVLHFDNRAEVIPQRWLAFTEVVRQSGITVLQHATEVSSLVVFLFGAPFNHPVYPPPKPEEEDAPHAPDEKEDRAEDEEEGPKDDRVFVSADVWIDLKCDKEMAPLLGKLRKNWQAYLSAGLQNQQQNLQKFNSVVPLLVELLQLDEFSREKQGKDHGLFQYQNSPQISANRGRGAGRGGRGGRGSFSDQGGSRGRGRGGRGRGRGGRSRGRGGRGGRVGRGRGGGRGDLGH